MQLVFSVWFGSNIGRDSWEKPLPRLEAWGGSDDWEFEFEPEIVRQQPVRVSFHEEERMVNLGVNISSKHNRQLLFYRFPPSIWVKDGKKKFEYKNEIQI